MLSAALAASSAASDAARPTSSGMATYGNTTTSRRGSTGRRSGVAKFSPSTRKEAIWERYCRSPNRERRHAQRLTASSELGSTAPNLNAAASRAAARLRLTLHEAPYAVRHGRTKKQKGHTDLVCPR